MAEATGLNYSTPILVTLMAGWFLRERITQPRWMFVVAGFVGMLLIVRPGNVPRVEQKFEATLVWMSEEPMVPGKSYWFKQTSKLTPGAISTLRYQIDVNTLHRQNAPTLKLNEIGRCTIALSQPICFDGWAGGARPRLPMSVRPPWRRRMPSGTS